ncbi:RagB/SusD family nutrient uptake outer membrane protein [Chitinophaga sancti]|uniref:RagB/SusD family nutrient uptake outer membrane protein n=1 Tax=Chitinophaga sancti TaxID=1004 RepID=UPI003F7A0103
MKKFSLFIITAGAVAISMSACKKDWLNPDVENQLATSDSIYTDNSNATKFTTACYTNLLTWAESSFAWVGLSSITSDDADKGSSSGDNGSDKDQLDAITYTSTSGSLNDGWKGNYQGVSNCNVALQQIPLFTKLDAATATQLKGEARFLRAYYYFNLVRMFGNIPLVDTVLNADDPASLLKGNTQVAPSVIYAFIESDLNYAISVLPTVDNQAAKDIGRANKGAATALLAKVSLYEKKYQQAYDLTTQIISGAVGSYALVSDYSKIWREVGENSTESLFEVQAKSGSPKAGVQQYTVIQSMRGATFAGVTTAVTGWGFNTPSEDLDNSYEAGDLRKKATIIHVGDTLFDGVILKSAVNQRYNYKAYVSATQENYSGDADLTNKNVRILRMGDIYLINAEAANELGNTATAITDVNKIRNRAGLGNTTASTQSDLRTAIWNERRWELAMEHDRFFDLIRQGRAGTVLRALGKKFVDGKNEVFPIPETEISASGNALKQNTGY